MDNALSIYWHSLSKDCPGKVWWSLNFSHPAVYRALRIDPTDHGAVYACAPLRLYKGDAGVRILAAYPAPRMLDEPDPDWLGIEAVIAWNPVDDTAEVMGDKTPQIVGNLSDEANVIFASPRAFFQRWAMNRARYLVMREMAKGQAWNRPPQENDEAPGVLMIGAPNEIRWRPSAMPADIACSGVDPKTINRELLKAARLPRARGDAA